MTHTVCTEELSDSVVKLVNKKTLVGSLGVRVDDDAVGLRVVEAVRILLVAFLVVTSEGRLLVEGDVDTSMSRDFCVGKHILVGHAFCASLSDNLTNHALVWSAELRVVRDVLTGVGIKLFSLPSQL